MKRLFYVMFLLTLLLISCAPVRSIALGAINAVGRADDNTTVALYEKGIEVIPVGQKDSVVLSVLGETLEVNDSRCEAVEKSDTGLLTTSCFLETITAPTTISLTGTKRGVFLSWLENGELVRRFLIVSEINQ